VRDAAAQELSASRQQLGRLQEFTVKVRSHRRPCGHAYESSHTFTTNIYARGRPSPTTTTAPTSGWSNLALASKADSSTPSPSQHLRSCAAASCRVGFGGGLGHTQAHLSGSSPPPRTRRPFARDEGGGRGSSATLLGRARWHGGAVGRLDAYLSLRSRSTCPGFLCLRFSCTCW
jgi:hypothetical protein